MINAKRTQNLPANLDEFVAEIGDTLGAMYGSAARDAYTGIAEDSYGRLIRHPDVRVWTDDAAESPGLLMSIVRRGVVHFTLLHVLEPARGHAVEDALLDTAIRELRDSGVRAIIGEFVRTRPLAVEAAMKRYGFTRFDRRMMIAGLAEPALSQESSLVTTPCGAGDAACARILVDAYREHPSRAMHPEAHTEEEAAAFLKAYRGGTFGRTARAYYRVYPKDGRVEGMLIGAEAAPGVGFILHVATARASQGRGIGAALIRETALEFRRARYERLVLGVTCGNPAERLYERLGFKPFLPVETYVWWANEDP